MNYKLIAYAEDFASFLIENLGKESEFIKQIILFGSTARGEADENSDIDLFVNTDKKIEEKLNKIKEEFYNSIKFKKYWKLLNVQNEINLSVGKLADWGDLKTSINANGITLYGKYAGEAKLKQNYLFIATPVKDRNKSISVWRELYGYTQKAKKKEYVQEGLIKKYNGRKISRGVFFIPVEHSQEIIRYLRSKKFGTQIIPFFKED